MEEAGDLYGPLAECMDPRWLGCVQDGRPGYGELLLISQSWGASGVRTKAADMGNCDWANGRSGIALDGGIVWDALDVFALSPRELANGVSAVKWDGGDVGESGRVLCGVHLVLVRRRF